MSFYSTNGDLFIYLFVLILVNEDGHHNQPNTGLHKKWLLVWHPGRLRVSPGLGLCVISSCDNLSKTKRKVKMYETLSHSHSVGMNWIRKRETGREKTTSVSLHPSVVLTARFLSAGTSCLLLSVHLQREADSWTDVQLRPPSGICKLICAVCHFPTFPPRSSPRCLLGSPRATVFMTDINDLVLLEENSKS